MNTLTARQEYKLKNALIDLIQSADDFTQLKILASTCDILYSPSDIFHIVLYEEIEKTARHLKGLPAIGDLLRNR